MRDHAEITGTIGTVMAITFPSLHQLGIVVQLVGAVLGLILTSLGIYYMKLKIKKLKDDSRSNKAI